MFPIRNNVMIIMWAIELKRIQITKIKIIKFLNSNSDTNRTNFNRIIKETKFVNKLLYNNYISGTKYKM